MLKVLYGEDDFTKQRFIRNAALAVEASGGQVLRYDEEGGKEVVWAAKSPALLCDNPSRLFILKVSAASDVEALAALPALANSETGFLLVSDGNLDKRWKVWKNFLKNLPPQDMHEYKEPAPWEAKEHAQRLLARYSKEVGVEVSARLAGRIIARAGTDAGILYHEVLKASYANSEEEALENVATLSNFGADEIARAIAAGSAKAFLAYAARIESMTPNDPTMNVLIPLGNRVAQWVKILSLEKKGLGPKEIAADIGANPFYLSKVLIPEARTVGMKRSILTLRLIGSTIAKVMEYTASPWSCFQSQMVKVLNG